MSRTLAAQPHDDPDRPLVHRARGGDLEAFGELVERHRVAVQRVAAGMVGSTDADDVAQEVFLRALHRLERFRGEAPFRAWLLRIAHNTAVSEVRTRRPEPVDEAPDAGGGPRTPADELERREQADRLRTKLGLLSPAHRAVVVLRDLEGLSYEEIAEITDAPLGSVKGRLHRARRELIELLRANTYDWGLPDER
jgi:RNA polymerase sigma-70 factor (ECF subfamily)